MQTLGLDEETADKPVDPSAPYVGFWKRQFEQEQTSGQRIFDLIFGVVMPVICFYFDPVVFKTTTFGMKSLNVGWTLFAQYRPFAYLFTFVAIMALTGWLLRVENLRSFSAAFGTSFAVGSTMALIIGVILFPFSLLGLIMIIGVLGFVPLFTSFVYLRNSIIALRIARVVAERRTLIYAGVLTALFSLVVPYVANVEINRKLEEIVQGDATTVDDNINALKWVAPLVNTDKVITAFRKPDSPTDGNLKKDALANAYYQITGEDLSKAADNSCPGC